MKSGQITDPDSLFNALSLEIHDNYKKVGIALGLQYKVLTDELESGVMLMGKDSNKAMKMLHLWRDSVSEEDCTYSVLAAALEKQGFLRCAQKYCYAVPKGNEVGRYCSTLSKLIIIWRGSDYIYREYCA